MNTQTKTLMYQRIFNPGICRLFLGSFFSALCLIALSTQGATITVTNTNDSGVGSLRKAIADAHNGDTIEFAVAGLIGLSTGELLVAKSVTISGPGAASLTIDGNATSRVFHVSSGVTAAIAGLTVTNGTGWDQDLTNAGGGIYNDHSTLALNNCTVSGNSAGWGGGIYNDHATLALDNCTVSGNTGSWGGGAINNSSGTLTLTNSTLSGNWAAAPGSVGDGGAILNDGYDGNATVTVISSTFSGNQSYHIGGGIYNGGGATLTVKNSTFSDNYDFAGDAIFNMGSMTIGSTILNGPYGNLYNFYGTVTSLGYNLSSDAAAGFLTAMGDQINTDPMLGPLQDNGGPTFTHAPLTGSVAIDAGKNFTAGTTDQRGAGFIRTFDSASVANANGGDGSDIGACEVQGPPLQYAASIQQPINADGTSVFNSRRGVVPVKFSLTLGGVATCNLPPATIAVTRTAGGTIGPIDESDYNGSADNGSNFRIVNCQYAYNLSTGALGVGTYRVDAIIHGQVVGSATFGLR